MEPKTGARPLNEKQIEEARSALEALHPLAGNWTGKGIVFDPEGRETPMTSSESYEWLEGGFFLLHRWHMKWGRNTFQGVELLGWDPDKRSLVSTMYDNLGHRVSYDVSADGGTLHFQSEQQRAELRLGDGAFDDTWEITRDGKTWRPLCRVRCEKAKPRRTMGFFSD